MGRGRKKKLLIIIILLGAVTSLSIGLATFSNILTISSRATVKPNEGEYKVTVYGSEVNPLTMNNTQPPESLDEFMSKYMSTTHSLPGIVGKNIIASPAIIDNNQFIIRNLDVTFNYNQDASLINGVIYLFLLVNEGTSDIFFDSLQLEELTATRLGVCTATDETKQELVDQNCGIVIATVLLARLTPDMEFSALTEDGLAERNFKLSPGENIAFNVAIGMDGNFDKNIITETGEFSIQFEDITLPFGSTAMYSE